MSQVAPQRGDVPGVFQASRASATRLVHLIPDQLADEVPEHVLFAFAKTPRPDDGFVEVTARQFAAAVNRASWFLQDVLGPASGFETVGYMGPSKSHSVGKTSWIDTYMAVDDLRYFFLMFGAIKVGYKVRAHSTQALKTVTSLT